MNKMMDDVQQHHRKKYINNNNNNNILLVVNCKTTREDGMNRDKDLKLPFIYSTCKTPHLERKWGK
jgi:hypothetical protein